MRPNEPEDEAAMVSGGRADTRWCVTVTIELTGRSPIFAAIALAVQPMMAANPLIDGGVA
jgi:hypothetical protein